MSRRTYFFSIFLSAILGGIIALTIDQFLFKTPASDFRAMEEARNVKVASIFSDSSFIVPDGLNFIYAAELVTPSVVHIKSSFEAGKRLFNNPLEEYFDFGPHERRGQGYGSGVVISSDGYIVTNYHVIEEASDMEVTFYNGKKQKAYLVGQDPTTDLAVIKVKANNLPFTRFGSSDNVKVGEWVLAIGNPYAHGKSYDLTSTVTAGIVSAKGRNIGILHDSLRIESFIQTDAAVNPGNSGGALINLKGELIGINTAIASPTGSYSGYSFAVPVSIVKKVAEDLLQYGDVQRALLGVTISEIDDRIATHGNLNEFNGVFIEGVSPNGAASEAGIEANDIIVSINDKPVNSVPQLQELIAQQRPGDKVQVEVKRKGERKVFMAFLKNANRNHTEPETAVLD